MTARAAFSGRSSRALLTTFDQGIFSVSNFAVGIAIAHISGVAGLGSYSLAYALWLIFQALHRALITDPMAIEGDVRHPDAARYLATGLASELTLGLVAVAVFAVLSVALLTAGQHSFGIALLALAPWLPALLAQDYWRWVGFLQGRPGKSLANDVVFDCVQAGIFIGLVLAGIRSPVVAIGAWGAGAAAGALLGLRQFAVRPTMRGGRAKLRSHWHFSRWLSANSVMAWGSSQSFTVLTAALLGPVGVGGVRAAQTLVSGPSLVIFQSGGSLGLAEASRGLAEKGWPGLRKVARFITLAGLSSVGLIAVVVFVDAGPLLRFFYGPKFGRYATPAKLMALGATMNALALGSILTLKTTRQTRALFGASAFQMATTTLAIVILAPIWGVVGAATAMVTGIAASTGALLVASRRTFRRPPPSAAPVSTGAHAGDDGNGTAPDTAAAAGETLGLVASAAQVPEVRTR
jgi:O-antigen/teichoic acid export membrane protein